MSASPARRGFTITESLVIAALAGASVACAAAMSAGPPPSAHRGGLIAALTKARASARQLKDATMVRGIVQSFVIHAQNNQGVYPLPSRIDTANKTVKAEGRAKDTTANIFSILVWNGHISTEICVSAAEVNKKIQRDDDYEFTSPKAAVTPAEAEWDPAFSCDFLHPPGNVSFAVLQTSDPRMSMWSDTFSTTEAVVGNRGPAIASVGVDAEGRPSAKLRVRQWSKTFLIHGPRKSWEGNIAYNDGHVTFETAYTPEGVTYTLPNADAAGNKVTRPDNIFFDEPDAAGGKNIYLGIWRRAGATPKDFGGVWD